MNGSLRFAFLVAGAVVVAVVPTGSVWGETKPIVVPAPKEPVPPPKPPAELDQLKAMEGTWRCDGRAPAGTSGPAHAYRSTWRFKRDLDGFWWVAEYQQKKSRENPMPLQARAYVTWDSAAKLFLLMGVDNLGGYSNETTAGWNGDVLTIAGEIVTGGKKMPFREVITKKGDREFSWRGEMKLVDWVTLGEDICKK